MHWYNLNKAKNRFKRPKDTSVAELWNFENFSSDGLMDCSLMG